MPKYIHNTNTNNKEMQNLQNIILNFEINTYKTQFSKIKSGRTIKKYLLLYVRK